MSTLLEAKRVVTSLSPTDKAKLAASIVTEIDDVPGITKTPDVCGGSACVAGTRIAVWLLQEGWQSGLDDATLLEWYPTLAAEDLPNARLYAATHPEEIAREIRINNAVMDPDFDVDRDPIPS